MLERMPEQQFCVGIHGLLSHAYAPEPLHALGKGREAHGLELARNERLVQRIGMPAQQPRVQNAAQSQRAVEKVLVHVHEVEQ